MKDAPSIDEMRRSRVVRDSSATRFGWSPLNRSTVYGRDSEIEQTIKILQDGSSEEKDDQQDHELGGVLGKSKIRVVAIVGKSGIGKTTVARSVFQDPRVEEIFDLKAWSSDGQELYIFPSTKSSDDFSRHFYVIYNYGDLSSIGYLKLRKELIGRRFLIVLDDFCDGDPIDRLQTLVHSLGSVEGAPGSTVIFTTHNMVHKDSTIARLFDHPIFILRLRELSLDACWNLIKARAFGDSPPGAQDSRFEAIGRKLAAKCLGFPLAAETIGALLSFKSDFNEWEAIANNRIWDLPHAQIQIIPPLLLNYQFLPPYLVRCFIYFSIFPKNFKFSQQFLMCTWIAEGLIEVGTDNRTSIEDIAYIAKNYFDQLVMRSFIQKSSLNNYFQVHDLIHDLAIYAVDKSKGSLCVTPDGYSNRNRGDMKWKLWIWLLRHLQLSVQRCLKDLKQLYLADEIAAKALPTWPQSNTTVFSQVTFSHSKSQSSTYN